VNASEPTPVLTPEIDPRPLPPPAPFAINNKFAETPDVASVFDIRAV
jgi:hypothetical protein